ncbi:MAG: hypothetical protein L3J86_01275 [Thermoplasmata archaeon]|nr:hypothetical protein [Thermoplasmata archaeon]
MAQAMGSYGDAKRAATARADLPTFVGTGLPVGLILLDDDDQEQSVLEGEVIRVDRDSVIFRHSDQDEEIALGIISKRIQGETVVVYGGSAPL